MNYEQIKKHIHMNLRNAFQVSHVKQEIVDQSQIRDQRIISENEVQCISFVLNNEEKHFLFYLMKQEGVFFARTKEGILDVLASQLRFHDFTFELTNQVQYANDVTGKLLEGIIGRNARQSMLNIFNFWKSEAESRGNVFHYTLGYKLTSVDKIKMSFDAEFELNVRNDNEDEFTTYRGEIVNSEIYSIKTVWNGTRTTLSDIFY